LKISDLLKSEIEWDRNFTKLVKQRIEKGVIITKKSTETSEELNKRRMDYFKDNTSSISEEKYLCTICSKVIAIIII